MDEEPKQESGDKSIPPEVSKDIPLSEELARVITDIEYEMFIKGVPSAEWSRINQEAFVSHPRLTDYKEIFDSVINRAQSAKAALDKFWEKNQVPESIEGTDAKILVTTGEVAGPQTAKKLYQSIFESEPHGEVDAVKGAITLRFILDEEDFKNSGSDPEIAGGGLIKRYGLFPVIVVHRKAYEQPEELATIINHELQHAKQNIAEEGLFRFIGDSKIETSPPISKLIHRAIKYDLPYRFKAARHEILAFFSPIGLYEFGDVYSKYGEEVVLNKIAEHCRTITSILTDPESSYESSYFKHYGIDKQDQGYIDSVAKGVDALFDLYRLYHHLGYGIRTTRMTINVLEQFDLHYWPAVVRLLKRAHKNVIGGQKKLNTSAE